jgi:hypothetical protein
LNIAENDYASDNESDHRLRAILGRTYAHLRGFDNFHTRTIRFTGDDSMTCTNPSCGKETREDKISAKFYGASFFLAFMHTICVTGRGERAAANAGEIAT